MRQPYCGRSGARRRAAGFTMLEILVSLFIVAIGVLGTAGLQAFALKMNQGGQFRSQAVILGIDFIERVEANNTAAIVGAYAPATYPTSASKDCSAVVCSPTELATYDLVQFKTRLDATLPGASITLGMTGSGPFTYTVQINWQERITRAARTTVATGGTTTVDATGKMETFSYSISRMFQNRSLIV